MSRIFFGNTSNNPDHEPCIEITIYSDDGTLLASHVMTIEGAHTRRIDFDAAIDGATAQRTLAVYFGVKDA